MNDYLLDTCVISEPKQKTPNKDVLDWMKNQKEQKLFLSVITIGEIEKGIARLQKSKKRTGLEKWSSELRTRFSNRILPLTTDVLINWGRMLGELEKKGIVRPSIDSLLEATALTHNLTFVTRNVKNFSKTQVKIFNPWSV
jgi:predicted nucleic acid-binding protein